MKRLYEEDPWVYDDTDHREMPKWVKAEYKEFWKDLTWLAGVVLAVLGAIYAAHWLHEKQIACLDKELAMKWPVVDCLGDRP